MQVFGVAERCLLDPESSHKHAGVWGTQFELAAYQSWQPCYVLFGFGGVQSLGDEVSMFYLHWQPQQTSLLLMPSIQARILS